MPPTNEAFSRVRIDAQLKDQGWDVLDIHSVRFEYVLPDRTKADDVLCDRNGRALAVIEAKKAAINPAEAQARGYARQLEVPYDTLCREIAAGRRKLLVETATGTGKRRSSMATNKRDSMTGEELGLKLLAVAERHPEVLRELAG